MVTVVTWFVRIMLLIIFIDWFRLRSAEDDAPAGIIEINRSSNPASVHCRFGFGPEDVEEGDRIKVEIHFVN